MDLASITELVGELVSVGVLAAIGAAVALRLTRDAAPAPQPIPAHTSDIPSA